MSAIEHSLQMIEYAIPQVVLQKAFPANGFSIHTLHDRIRETIIRDRVIVDANLVGGEVVYLPVVEGRRTNVRQNEIAIFYSDRYLAGREIMSVHAYYSTLGYGSHGMPGGQGGSTTNTSQGNAAASDCSPCSVDRFCDPTRNLMIKQASELAMNTLTGIQDPVNTSTSLIAKNTILLRHTVPIYGGAFRTVLSNDPYLNNIQPRSWQAFGEMCTLAAKSYIYNQTIISLGRSKLLEGVESSQLTQIIDSYADSEQQYLEFLRTRWSKTAYMNDNNQWSTHIRSMFGFRG